MGGVNPTEKTEGKSSSRPCALGGGRWPVSAARYPPCGAEMGTGVGYCSENRALSASDTRCGGARATGTRKPNRAAWRHPRPVLREFERMGEGGRSRGITRTAGRRLAGNRATVAVGAGAGPTRTAAFLRAMTSAPPPRANAWAATNWAHGPWTAAGSMCRRHLPSDRLPPDGSCDARSPQRTQSPLRQAKYAAIPGDICWRRCIPELRRSRAGRKICQGQRLTGG